jgi:hypothetical protein
MIKIRQIYVLFFVIFLAGIASSTNIKEANNLYQNGNFTQAIPLYKSLLGEHPQNPYYHYNLANCYYKTGKTGKAIVEFYRAFDLLPRDSDIRQNLSLALTSVGESLVWRGVPSIIHKLYFYFSLAELKGIFWLFFWFWAILVASYFIFNPKHKVFKIGIYILTVCILFFGIWAMIRNISKNKNVAVITEPSVAVRAGPGEKFTILLYANEGGFVSITDKKDNWYEVKIKKQAVKGWMKKDSLDVI